jgi:hypothetical protein
MTRNRTRGASKRTIGGSSATSTRGPSGERAAPRAAATEQGGRTPGGARGEAHAEPFARIEGRHEEALDVGAAGRCRERLLEELKH